MFELNELQAKRCLRDKKVAEGRVDRLSESISNLRLMLAQLRDSQSDAQVLLHHIPPSPSTRSLPTSDLSPEPIHTGNLPLSHSLTL
jgi:hypothetical protein